MYVQPAGAGESTDDLRILSDDLLNILQYRGSLPGHPDLASVMSSRADWNARAPILQADVRSMLPQGTRFYLSTTYGDIGDVPPDSAPKHVRAFEAFAAEENTIIEGTLIVWRVQG